ncbi:MAG TPA: 50S ribosomal protein L24 [Candidatus Marinimicrobia bacterium]|jgi:large subunit ribosomal protein L24|nr:50S ribosomal protein L24 [Candidatus Neomarinimicrobiota bacterium]MDP6275447.1 50S ribosomal protein L24 [Candidatus Neomarinimicrobiota bacterium]MDP7217088.1 50S ribosomal protein L24 [Candidatus Neomarinimicrobiota bacterium]HJL75199.1 50S ribosomal protein L24 [Candidatus Neomarinimicrobiota bacterium]HJM70494.1 50S ribosomal protein L24 [Candidatus Neomarinimicrobiota bacterium]|tara:strand:- start:10298 stop:10603 length:306 start_codon:yes stop_codon:yes gene_type:complete
MHIKKGMTVRVISGNHKGSEGKVLHIFPDSEKVIIEGVNLVKRATRPTQENPAGGYVEKEGPIHISNMLPVHKGNTTRVGYKILDNGRKIRVAAKTGEELE